MQATQHRLGDNLTIQRYFTGIRNYSQHPKVADGLSVDVADVGYNNQ
jgi:hypothetical protein